MRDKSFIKKAINKMSFFLGFDSGEKEVMNAFMRQYEEAVSNLQKNNEIVADEKAVEAEKLIAPVEGRKLDIQQMNCIVKSAKNHLVLAGAGTGKTTTIVGYVKYLLKSNICKEEDILVLSYTNASATEMSQRLEKEISKPLTALTFHKLGVDIIAKVEGKKPRIYSLDIRQFARKQLDILIRDTKYLKKICKYLIYNGIAHKSEFDFKTEEEYEMYLKYNQPITLLNEEVKSYGEMDIGNFLTENGISYVYEATYPIDTTTAEYGQYHPDFYLPKFDVYIEYFAIDRNNQVPEHFSGKNGKTPAEAYCEGIQWKRELHRDNNTRLVEVYSYEKLEGTLIPKLKERLEEAGVVFEPVSTNELWEKVKGGNNQNLDRIAELFGTVITLIKSNNSNISQIRTKNKNYINLLSISSVLDIVEPVYESYEKILKENNEIDFNDMINLATKYIVTNQFQHNYKYVIIDEYQDISKSRYWLLSAMRKQKDYNLFCVGDDWQSIYRFSGSDIGFILNFEKYWGATEISRIETTYRFSQSLIQVSGAFVMKNPLQKRKNLKSITRDAGFSLGKITGYTETNAVNFLGDKLKDLPQKSEVLFLGRYRFDVRMLESNPDFSYKYNAVTGKTEVVYSKRKDLEITFMTVHSSKGLQADYVFILNNKGVGMGFPSQISDAPVLKLLLDNCDIYPFAEERRLFYVAITRAKKKVWLVTIERNQSAFVKEIEEAFSEEIAKERYTCPECGGRLLKKIGQYGDFYGCSNYKNLGCKYKRPIKKKVD